MIVRMFQRERYTVQYITVNCSSVSPLQRQFFFEYKLIKTQSTFFHIKGSLVTFRKFRTSHRLGTYRVDLLYEFHIVQQRYKRNKIWEGHLMSLLTPCHLFTRTPTFNLCTSNPDYYHNITKKSSKRYVCTYCFSPRYSNGLKKIL